MILPDVKSEFHDSAAAWLKEALTTQQVFFTWHTITGFLRIVTNNRIYENPLDMPRAIQIVDSWLANDTAHLVSLKKSNWPLLSKILIETQSNGNLVMDAHLAAMAASCGAAVAKPE